MRESPRSRGVLRLLAAGLLGFAGASPALAQGQVATIGGRVLTPQGQPLQGANVFITEMSISVGTNAQGRYTITVPGQRVNGQTVQLRVRSIGTSRSPSRYASWRVTRRWTLPSRRTSTA